MKNFEAKIVQNIITLYVAEFEDLLNKISNE